MKRINAFLRAANWQVTEGTAFGWDCFGPNIRYLIASINETDVHASAIFSTESKELYVMELFVAEQNTNRRWINPKYQETYRSAFIARALDPDRADEVSQFIDTDFDDMLRRTTEAFSGPRYSDIDLHLEEEVAVAAMKVAHGKDITLNELVDEILRDAIQRARAENGE